MSEARRVSQHPPASNTEYERGRQAERKRIAEAVRRLVTDSDLEVYCEGWIDALDGVLAIRNSYVDVGEKRERRRIAEAVRGLASPSPWSQLIRRDEVLAIIEGTTVGRWRGRDHR